MLRRLLRRLASQRRRTISLSCARTSFGMMWCSPRSIARVCASIMLNSRRSHTSRIYSCDHKHARRVRAHWHAVFARACVRAPVFARAPALVCARACLWGRAHADRFAWACVRVCTYLLIGRIHTAVGTAADQLHTRCRALGPAPTSTHALVRTCGRAGGWGLCVRPLLAGRDLCGLAATGALGLCQP
jgi:hypothetical protein